MYMIAVQGVGAFLLTPRGRVWEGTSPSHGRDLWEMVQNTQVICKMMFNFPEIVPIETCI